MTDFRFDADHAIREAIRSGKDELVQQQGEIVREYLNAYLNHDARSAHPDGKVGDLGQLARNRAPADARKGFAGEILCEAHMNEQAIREGRAQRVRRTNNNDPLVDLAVLDGHGRSIPGMGIQVKFEGKNAKEALAKFNDPEHRKYLDHNVAIAIPDDHYDVLMGDGPDSIDAAIAALRDKLQRARESGDNNAAQHIQERIDRNQHIKRNLRKAGATNTEAKHARYGAAKGVVKNVHEAAAAHAKHAAVGAGTVAFITNLVACIQGEKTPVQAAQDTGKSTALTAAFDYVATAISTAVTGAMRNSGSDYVKSLGAAGIMPAVMDSAVDTVKLVNALARGQINQEEFMDALADHNIGALGNLYGAAIAQTGAHALSLSAGAQFAAGMVGGTLGYQLAMATYTILKESAKDYQHAKEERIRIERECAEVVELITRYRTQLSRNVSQYMGERLSVFNEAMVAMDAALVANDPDGFLAANADIQRILHHDAQFRSQQEFDEFMDSDDPLVL
ncbi:hypothetical protein [Bifidobacterium magnum]|uniref:Uncharacterized protein n=1 Tax=Bifidobacterium magnum TaxID=1692 RepID=A0A087B9A3_9BIFI|nr:hypothetical protein [Bifidobacterium magnum]KFI67603.1 hypothetical protein BMAGN_0804 [Bifidobacterium magnum]